MHAESLLGDVYRYGERVYLQIQFMAAIIIGLLMAFAFKIPTLLDNPNNFDILFMVVAVWLVPRLVFQWRRMRLDMSMFEVLPSSGRNKMLVEIAPHASIRNFRPVPPQFIRHADKPASEEVLVEINDLCSRFVQVEGQRALCQSTHGELTNHDAANLLLMGSALRKRAQHRI